MTHWKFVLSTGVLASIILTISSFIQGYFVYHLMTGTRILIPNFYYAILFGFAICWGFQYEYNKLRGSNSVNKGVILTVEVWLIFGILGAIISYIAWYNYTSDNSFIIPYIIVNLIISLVFYIFIGFLIGKIWDKMKLKPHESHGSHSVPDRRCPNCSRGIPFDAKFCPYCMKKFEEF